MITKTVKIQLGAGIDVEPVAMLVQIANQYQSEIYLQDDKHKFNAKSIMGMMTLCMAECQEIEVAAEGKDAQEAVNHIESYLKSVQN